MPLVEYRSKPSALVYMARAVLPSAAKRRPLAAPELVLRWRGVRLASSELEPVLYFHVAGFRLHMALLTHPAFPLPIWKMLQVRNRLVQHRALASGSRVDLELRLAALRVLEKGMEADLHLSVTESASLAWEGVTTFYARGRFGATAEGAVPSPPEPPGPPIGEWTVPEHGALRFARLTGDYNGLHLSDAYARRMGFAKAFLHPQRVLDACLKRLAPRAPRVLEAWLKGPVPYGAKARLCTADADGGCRFGLWTEFDPRPAILGIMRP